ncbi:hypothetical protein CDL12_15499 [Handroanthus impetiginosus]|uniref:Uncharacterized protein n=1 Tax=Handroanthus impetiginosus TaxID=429701 RepID=A0A2G9H2Z4_9LAMI|nr:hypothetical protein CDL12_15499 [Handroanthus impetiginosus]
MEKAKARILKPLKPLCSKLASIKGLMIMKNNKVGPIVGNNKNDNGFNLDRRDNEYLEARRAVLSSYHLSYGHSLREKMKRSLKRLNWDAISSIPQALIGVKVYKFTLGCPWSSGVLVFRCYLPHLKCTI